MAEPLTVVTVRIPQEIAARAKILAAVQDRTVQAVYGRALRLGLELEEERDRIASEAIEAAERRRASTGPGREG
jgi:predicted transcriptional regulator